MKSYFSHIDGLRAVAVIGVLLFHLDIALFKGGYAGVDVFFVISGFLITRLLLHEYSETGRIRFAAFYWRRIRRLLPALLATLAVSIVLAALFLSPGGFSRFAASVLTTLFSASNVYFWLQADYFDTAAQSKPLLHTWSLSVEEQFYLVWPAVTLLLLRCRRKWALPLAAFVFGYMSIRMNGEFADGSIALISDYFPSLASVFFNARPTLFYLLPFRVYEFMIGAAVVFTMSWRRFALWFDDLIFLAGIAMIGASFLMFDNTIVFPGRYALLPCIGTAFVIYAGGTARTAAVVRSRAIVGIGLISYSLYLVHWPLIVFWKEAAPLDTEAILLIVAASFGLAYLSYRYIEQPFRRADAFQSWQARAALAAVPLLLSLCSVAIVTGDGWKWRVSRTIISLENEGESADFHRLHYGGAGYPTYGAVNTNRVADVVLMGDSHAGHYAEGLFQEWIRPNGLSLFTAFGTSCLHLPGMTRVTAGMNFDHNCPTSLNRGLQFVKEGNRPIVILSHAWLDQIELAGLLDASGRRIERKVEISDIRQALRVLKERIHPSRLVVIGQVPGAGRKLYDLALRPSLPFLPALSEEALLFSPVRFRAVSLNRALASAAAEDGYIFLDPHDILCSGQQCRNVDDAGHLLYSDEGHLSKAGSRSVIRGFLPALQQLRE